MEKLWRYKTEHVDLMLWQYAEGLLDAYKACGAATSGVPATANQKLTERFKYLKDRFCKPSFMVQVVWESGSPELQKTPIE
jgi:hypothetical protein